MPSPTTRVAARRALLSLLADALFVVLFATVGRSSHDAALTPLGIAETAWPFLVALGAGWLVSRAWRAPRAPWRTGVPVWLVTVAGGMLLRALTGQGTALPFIVVATLALLVQLVGWRLIATWRPRRERERDASTDS
ncbi:DUF3054 domain-containing protein [Agrococcus carbonis]|uniref:DUF3054 domain-containing protein n=1 Tax=Agrococcus carbonis TaxID=684552 RepID=A0A1H1NEA5_9MICO|nr:DUF3054 domain-containing protein [Agrococcus carbonis]SDR97316.1 Protein of unknown function [Agrococcus carbonis]